MKESQGGGCIVNRKISLTLSLFHSLTQISVWLSGVVLCFAAVGFAQIPSDSAVQERQVVERFWTVLAKSPRRGTSFDRVYGYYVDTGHAAMLLEKCRNLLENAEPESPEAGKAQLLMGLVLERRGEREPAIEAFRLAADWDAENALPAFYLGQALLAEGRLDDAAEVLETAFRRKPLRADVQAVLETLGTVYRRLGEQAKSEEVLARLEALFPGDPDVSARIAETLESEGRWEDALARYEKLLAGESDDAARLRYATAAADIKRRLGRFQDALADDDALLDRLAPESWVAESVRTRIETLFEQQDDRAGLADFYRKRLERRPGETTSLRRLAATLQTLGKTDEALSLLEDALEKRPGDVPLRRDLAEMLAEKKDFAAAAEQYREIDRLTPGNADVILRWGQLILDDRQRDDESRKAEAVRIWRKRVDATPNDPAVAVTVADLMLRNYLPEEAEKLYRRAVEIRPDDPTYREYLAMFYHGRHEKAAFLDAIRPIAEGERRSPETLAQLGSILLSLGYVEEAEEPLKDAAALSPENVEVQWLSVVVLVRQNKAEEAATVLTRLERFLDGEERFDAFLQREVRFLREQGKLGDMARRLENRLGEIDLAAYSQGRGSLPPGFPEPESLVRTLWRLAAYREAEVQLGEATEFAEKALGIGTPGPRLQQYAADLFVKNGEDEKALAIYKRLSKIDGVWRVDSLRRLAELQLSLGKTENALETGRLVMGLGAGSAANVRFYADMLLNLGRRDEAIDVLRQSLRVDPGNESTLWLLAETLAQVQRESEAVEIAWRLFERSERTEDRLKVVEALSRYYRQSGEFDVLVERLASRTRFGRLPAEAALCLARAQETAGDFDAAFQTLEESLTAPAEAAGADEENAPDRFLLLRSLVDLAEKRNDLPAAVRCQERLVAVNRSGPELDRLFDLYDRAGETEKARDLFAQRILQIADKDQRLDAIDRMIARQQYDAVNRVFDFFDVHETPDWRVAFRRLAVDAYTGEWDITENTEEFRAMSFSETVQTPTAYASKSAGDVFHGRHQAWAKLFAPWRRPPFYRVFEKHEDFPGYFLHEIDRQNKFLATLVFRESVLGGPQSPLNVNYFGGYPARPRFEALDFREAKFFAYGWMLKDAFDKDAAVAVESRTWTNFTATVERIRAELPEDASDPQILRERLRFEFWLPRIVSCCEMTKHVFPDEGKRRPSPLALAFRLDGGNPSRSANVCYKIIRRLGLLGDRDWQPPLFRILLYEITDEEIAAKHLPRKTVSELFRNRIHHGGEEANETLFAEPSAELDDEPALTRDEKLDRVLAVAERFLSAPDAERDAFFRNFYSPDYPKLLWTLDISGRKDDIAQTRRQRDDWIRKNPLSAMQVAAELSRPFGEEVILDPLNVYPARFGEHPSAMQTLIRRILTIALENEPTDEIKRRERRKELGDAALASQSRFLCETELPSYWGLLNDRERKLLGDDISDLRGNLNLTNPYPEAHFLRDLVGMERYEAAWTRRPLRPEQLDAGEKILRDFEEIADFVLKFTDELHADLEPDAFLLAPPKPPESKAPTAGMLERCREELTGLRTVSRPLVAELLQHRNFEPAQGPLADLFFRLFLILRAADTKLARTEREVDGEWVAVESRLAERFCRFLDEKIAEGSPVQGQTLSAILAARADLATPLGTELLSVDSNEANRQRENAEFQRLTRRLEESRAERLAGGLDPDPTETLTLALLRARDSRFDEVLTLLDEIPLQRPGDLRTRNLIAAAIGLRLDNENYTEKTVAAGQTPYPYRQRTEAALDMLLLSRLGDQEALKLRPILERFGRQKDSDDIFDRLVRTSTDPAVLRLLASRLSFAGPEQKDLRQLLARRILFLPSLFKDSRNFLADYELHATALNILFESAMVEEVFERLEKRYNGLENETQRDLLLVELYRRSGRDEQARDQAAELSRRRISDRELQNIVLRQLRTLGLEREQKEFNRRQMQRE